MMDINNIPSKYHNTILNYKSYLDSLQDIDNCENLNSFISSSLITFALIGEDAVETEIEESNLLTIMMDCILHNDYFIKSIEKIYLSNISINNLHESKDTYNQGEYISKFIKLLFIPISCSNILNESDIVQFREIFIKNLNLLSKKSNVPYQNLVKILYQCLEDFDQNNIDLNFYFEKEEFNRIQGYFRGIKIISKCYLFSLQYNLILSKFFQTKVELINDSDYKHSLSRTIQNIYSLTHKFNVLTGNTAPHPITQGLPQIQNYISWFIYPNQKHLNYFLNVISKDFNIVKDRTYYEMILQHIKNSSYDKTLILSYAKNNLWSFIYNSRDSNANINNKSNRVEWSNKIYLISYKLLAQLESVKDARDTSWTIKVAIRLYHEWIQDVNEVINYFNELDEFDLIDKYLLEENLNIEWKSSFYMPMKINKLKNIEDLKRISKSENIIGNIVKAILAMINTEGGVIVVGVVEKFEQVKLDEIKENIYFRNKYAFFNINKELEYFGKNLDNIRLEILQDLVNETQQSEDKFNNLINYQEIKLYDANSRSHYSVYKIIVNKSKIPFLSVEKNNGAIYYRLRKRADGKSIYTDLSKEIRELYINNLKLDK